MRVKMCFVRDTEKDRVFACGTGADEEEVENCEDVAKWYLDKTGGTPDQILWVEANIPDKFEIDFSIVSLSLGDNYDD